MTFTIQPARLTVPLEAAFHRLERIGFAEMLWADWLRGLAVWSDDSEVLEAISNRLGWLNALDFVTRDLDRLRACGESVRASGLTDVVLLGMGGSSLAPEVLRRVIGVAPGYPRFRILDSVDPDAVRAAMANASSSLFVLASKSGSTIEPNAMAAEAEQQLRAAGIADVGSRFVAITDKDTVLHQRAVAQRYRDVFVNPSDIGGRYSALSFFGMVPAALMGIDLEGLLAPARDMARACREKDPRANPGLALGAVMAAGAKAGRDKLTLLLPEQLSAFGLWVEQLVAESTGKQGKGVTPVTGEPADVVRGDDRVLVHIADDGSAAPSVDEPLVSLQMRNRMDLGAEFFRWEVATATAGLLLDVNPFDEPNVKQAKDATKVLLDAYASSRRLPTPEPDASVGGCRMALSDEARTGLNGAPADAFLSLLEPGDYLGLLLYLPPDDETVENVVQAFRRDVSAATRCATTVGYGPRYLHSTGQLHKGGPNNGVFVLVTADAATDLPVPGETFSFGTLEKAQALGDFASLNATGRRALQLDLPSRDPGVLQTILSRLVAVAGSQTSLG